MKLENLRSLIRESINEYIREIDDQGTGAMYQAKKQACEAAIEKREAKLRSIEENEELKEMVDATKLKDIQKEINELRKYHKKLDNLIQKHANKGKKKEVVSDTKTEEAPLGEADVTAEMDMSDDVKEEALNESFLKMQKLAGVITEAEYNKKKSLNEIEDIAMQFSNTAPNTPPGATPGKTPQKQDPNINLIKARLKLAIPQLKINDTTPEFETLITSIADMIQSSNNSSLTDQEILTAYRRIIANKTKNMSKK
jgi:hypothetical protein